MTLETGVKALAEAIGTDVKALGEGKVDAEDGKQLSDENYTLAEKDKLGGIAVEATKNRADSENADKVHNHIIDGVTGLSTRLNGIGNLSQLPTQAKNNLVDAINELTQSFAELIPQIDDTAGLGDTDVTWSADKSSREIGELSALIGDVESVLVAINGEP